MVWAMLQEKDLESKPGSLSSPKNNHEWGLVGTRELGIKKMDQAQEGIGELGVKKMDRAQAGAKELGIEKMDQDLQACHCRPNVCGLGGTTCRLSGRVVSLAQR